MGSGKSRKQTHPARDPLLTCGDFGGKTPTGKPCGRPASLGVDKVRFPDLWDSGRCYSHLVDQVVRNPQTGLFEGLTTRESLYVLEFCGRANFNKKKAAELAGYSETEVTGIQVSQRPKVKAAIASVLRERVMTAEEILDRMTEIGRGSMDLFLTYDKKSKQFKVDLTKPEARANMHLIKKIDFDDKGRVKKIELHDMQKQLETLAKINKLLNDNPKINVAVNVEKMTDDEIQRRLQERLKTVTPAGPVNRVAGMFDDDGNSSSLS